MKLLSTLQGTKLNKNNENSTKRPSWKYELMKEYQKTAKGCIESRAPYIRTILDQAKRGSQKELNLSS